MANRALLKIVSASPLIDWFAKEFSVHICYLTRHPIAQSLSVMKNNWGITADAYVNNEYFADTYLSSKQVDFIKQTLSQGSYFQKAIVNWCLENLVPLKYSKTATLTITYEELVLNPENIIPIIAEKLELPDLKSMLKSLQQPSRSSKFSSKSKRDAIHKGDKRELLKQWTTKVSREQIIEVSKILESLEIDEYSPESTMPNDSLLHFPSSLYSSV